MLRFDRLGRRLKAAVGAGGGGGGGRRRLRGGGRAQSPSSRAGGQAAVRPPRPRLAVWPPPITAGRLRPRGSARRSEAAPERDAPFSTMSGEPIKPLYTEADLPADPEQSIGLPGEYPFTRGVYGSMYRGRLWTMRQFAGFGTAEETNAPVPLPARPRPDRAVDRVRHAVADGPRLRPPPLAGRGRARGRGGRHARRTWRRCSPGSRWTR